MTGPINSILNFNPSDVMPRPPEVGKDDSETIVNLMEYSRAMSNAFIDFVSLVRSNAAVYAFSEWTDGITTTYATATGSIDLSGIQSSIDFDIPLLRDIVFGLTGDTPPHITWTAGHIQYGGVEYDVAAEDGTTDSSGTMTAVYLDLRPATSGGGLDAVTDPAVATLEMTDSPTISDTEIDWYFASVNTGRTAIYKAFQSPIIHGGLIQVNTLQVNGTAVFGTGYDPLDKIDWKGEYTDHAALISALGDAVVNWAYKADDGYTYVCTVAGNPGTWEIMNQDGSDGAAGADGSDGSDGADGADGTSVFRASGVPAGGTGVDGDLYYDTNANNRPYVKISGSWVANSRWEHASSTTRIDGGDIYTGTIVADAIGVGAITAGKIDAGAVIAGKLSAGAIDVQIKAGDMPTTDPAATGLFITGDHLGYWNDTLNVWESYIDSSGNAVFSKSVTVGTLASTEGLQILVDGSGVTQAIGQVIFINEYYTTILDGIGLDQFGKTGSYSTAAADRVGRIREGDCYFDNMGQGNVNAGTRTTTFYHDSGRVGSLLAQKLHYTKATGVDTSIGIDVDPACLLFGSGVAGGTPEPNNKSIAARFYDSGWDTTGYTTSTDITKAHLLTSAPNVVIVWIRDHTNTQYQTMAQIQAYTQIYGTWLNEVDATNIKLRTGSSNPMIYYNSGVVYSTAVDIRVMAWL